MNTHRRSLTLWLSLLSCGLLLVLCFSACGTSTSNATASNPTPKPTATPSPSPTPSPTPTPAVTSFTGQGFSLSYPKAWQNKSSGVITTFISNDDSNISFTVTSIATTQSGNLDNALTGAVTGLKATMQNVQQDASAPTTVTVGGATWKQAVVTGDLASQGKTVHIKADVLVNQHQATGKFYVITYNAPADNFDQNNTTNFQPMLQSFKYA